MRWVALAWLLVWGVSYARVWGWTNFLHLCDLAVILTCLGIWRQVIRAADRQPLVEAARHYADSDESKRGFARDPERFLRNEWWRDWVPRLPMAPPAQAPALDVPHRIAKATFV